MYLEKIRTYWDSRAGGYSLTIHEQLASETADYYRRLLRDGAPKGEKLNCLDVGCGPGFFSILLAKDGHKVTAVDYSEGMLNQAAANFLEVGIHVTARQGDAQNLPFDNESFDYIVSRNLVWNLEQPEKAYEEWLRLLKPGGRLFIADANHYLYYYDNDYQMAKAAAGNDGTHANCYGVDPTPINEIARELPLSRMHRPAWDHDTLLGLGVGQMHVEVSRKCFTHNGTGEQKSLIGDFILWAEKPFDSLLDNANEQQAIDDRWTAASNNYSRIIHDELNSFRAQAWTERILDAAPKQTVLDILDAGCGPAFFSILLSKAGHRVIGLDGAKGMLEHAAQNAREYGVKPVFLQGDCHALPFTDASFDLVISRNVTHALRDHATVYSEWFRVLRPGGILLIFDANWHLMRSDPGIIEEFCRREAECLRVYGSTFSEGNNESEECRKMKPHRLGGVLRPQWDISSLRHAGFTDVTYEQDIIKNLWDEKEKLLYGVTPMFMIVGRKHEE